MPLSFFHFSVDFHLFLAGHHRGRHSSTVVLSRVGSVPQTELTTAFKNSLVIYHPYCTSSIPVWCEPVIVPGGPHIVVPKRGKLELRCHDNATTSGAPSRLKWLRERARRLEGEVEEGGVAYVKVSAVQAYHMGRYVCVNNSTMEHSSIYVYVKGGCMRWRGQMWNCSCLYVSNHIILI